ncbi:MAG TPA: dockerin type I repeat-containing protein [Pirellulales bacterium]|nr:dockerin type I repeat-containing protein [Pirellulales bacterium]
MTKRLLLKRGFAPVAVIVGLLASSARADIGWVIQPSQSSVVFSGSIGDVVFNYTDGTLGSEVDYQNGPLAGQPEWIQRYDGVPQALSQFSNINQDPNWGPYTNQGFTNSAQTSSSGTFTTVGNNFLQSLNFGAEPTVTTLANFHPTTQFTQSGNYYPNANGTAITGIYSAATPAQVGLTFAGAAGANIFATGTPAQQATYGTVLSPTPGGGPLDVGRGPNGTGDAGVAVLTNTAGYANSDGNSVTPTATGAFDATGLKFSGALAFSANVKTDNGANINAAFTQSLYFTLAGGLATIGNSLAGATGQFSRGPGGTYLMSVPYQASISFGSRGSDQGALNGQPDPGNPGHTYGPEIGTAIFLDLSFTAHFTAQATIAPGDANFDGIVNSQDLAAVSSNWLASDPNNPHTSPSLDPNSLLSGDVNGDGIVNSQDLALISSNWLGSTPPPSGSASANAAAVPEPGTWILLGIGGILLAIRRRIV